MRSCITSPFATSFEIFVLNQIVCIYISFRDYFAPLDVTALYIIYVAKKNNIE